LASSSLIGITSAHQRLQKWCWLNLECETGRGVNGISQKPTEQENRLKRKYGRPLLITITDWNVARMRQ